VRWKRLIYKAPTCSTHESLKVILDNSSILKMEAAGVSVTSVNFYKCSSFRLRLQNSGIFKYVWAKIRFVIIKCSALLMNGIKIFLPFLDAFAQLRNATIGFLMSDRLSVCMSVYLSFRRAWNNSAPTERIFVEFYMWIFFENPSIKFKFYLNLTRMRGTLHQNLRTCMIVSRWILLRIRNVSEKVLEKTKTHILHKVTFFLENRTVYEIMGKIC
jgi:hypothetical protein